MNEKERAKRAKKFLKNLKRDGITLLPRVRKCRLCGKKFFYPEFLEKEVDRYVASGLCFECGYWRKFLDHIPRHLQVTNGKCYKVLPFVSNKEPYMTLGGNGKKRYFVTKELKPIMSNDVWFIGTIPERFRYRLADTGWFCNESAYKSLCKFNKKCMEAGCLDRYRCFRFDTSIELKNGPYNTIPSDWVLKGEHCGFFLDTEKIIDYISPITPITNETTEKEND